MPLVNADGSLLLSLLLSHIEQLFQVIAHIKRVATAGGLTGAKVLKVITQLRTP